MYPEHIEDDAYFLREQDLRAYDRDTSEAPLARALKAATALLVLSVIALAMAAAMASTVFVLWYFMGT